MSAPRRFLAEVAAAVAVGLAVVAAINLVVDPWGVFRLVSVRGLNAEKPEQIFHDRLVRAHEVARLGPDALLMGTSRAQVGLDPADPALRAVAARPLNVGLSDGTPWEMARLLEHAVATGTVRLAVIGLDPLAFDVHRPPNVEWREARLAVDAAGRAQPLAVAADWPSILFSLDALRSSLRTVRRQATPSYFLEGGRRRTETMEARLAEEGGARRTLLWSERSYLRSFACWAPFDARGGSRTLDDLARLLAFARGRGIALKLFFSPSHVRSQLVLAAAGHWEAQEAWKRRVAALVEASGASAELWDFSGADPATTGEPVPAAGDRTARMRWYWESSHYRAELGSRVLRRVLGAPAGPEGAAFGRRVTAASVEGVLAAVRGEVAAYAAAHPDEVEEIEAAARQELPPRRCGPPAPSLASAVTGLLAAPPARPGGGG